MVKANYNPPSLSGKPERSLVPPGKCQFTEEWTAVPLLERIPVSKTSSVLRFGLPDKTLPMNLSTCACILARASISGDGSDGGGDGKAEDVVRPYTPISTNNLVGCFDLLIKDYGGNGMSNHMCKTMAVGETVDFKHIEFNVKKQAPFSQKKIIMLVGGTGITPMIQALHAILGGGDDNVAPKNEVVLFYGSRTEDDILGRTLVDSWAKDYPDQLKVVHVLSDEVSGRSEWKGRTGYITREVIEKEAEGYGPECGDDVIVFVCGPPPMYSALCGPRGEDEVKGLLADMGYKKEQVYKF
eukprot:jgi/Psemu1/304841/fgenesh1_kg.170_\